MAGLFTSLLAAPRVSTYQIQRRNEVADPFPSSVVMPPLPALPSSSANLIARPPQIDKYPTVIGAGLTGQYLSTAYRQCTFGWRYQFCDLLAELFEHDPHARGVTRQRVLPVSGARVEIQPAKVRAGDKDEKQAKDISDDFDAQIYRIPALRQALGQLNWAVVYGLTGSEIGWDNSEDQWEITSLSHIHTRRLNFPVSTSWDLYIYDQGLVGPGMSYMGPTTGIVGARVGDYPGKFITHAPALSAEYCTRDGEGRYIGTYMMLKRMIVRASAQDFERTIRPWVVGYFKRKLAGSDKEPIAQPEDIRALEAALSALGSGSMNNAALPDSVSIEILKAASAMNAEQFLSFLNREMSKALLGQAFTTEPGSNGNLSTSEMAAKGTAEILRYDAQCMADTLERDLATPWFKLNYPGVSLRLLPRIAVRVDEEPDPEKVMKLAVQGTSIGLPIDMDRLAEQTGLTLVAKDDKESRRTQMIAAGKEPEPAVPAESLTEPEVDPEADDADGSKAAEDDDGEKPAPVTTPKKKTGADKASAPEPKGKATKPAKEN